jgi:Icc-related predicted phosphoesterase
MRICAISDMHGNLNFNVQESDILVCAGDILPCNYYSNQEFMIIHQQESFIRDELIPWFKKQPVKDIVFIAGNHDWIFEWNRKIILNFPKNIHYLQDELIEIQGLKIYGTPQQPIFCDWAFNRSPERLEMFFNEIPEGLDILISHTAPFKIMDKVDFPNDKGHFGCRILRKKIKEVKPKYVIFGHFHGEHGMEKIDDMGDITFINASLLNEAYKLEKEPIYFEV